MITKSRQRFTCGNFHTTEKKWKWSECPPQTEVSTLHTRKYHAVTKNCAFIKLLVKRKKKAYSTCFKNEKYRSIISALGFTTAQKDALLLSGDGLFLCLSCIF